MKADKLNKPLQKAFAQFLEATPAERLNRNLRNMVLYYLYYELRDGGIPVEIEDLLFDLQNLFRLLDRVAEVGVKGPD